MILDFVDLKSDTTFKYLFKTEKGRIWFNDLILHTTGIDLEEYELYDNELSSGNKKKDYRLDLLLKNERDFIVIEMNGASKDQNIKARYYLYRVAGKKFTSGESYEESESKLIMFNNYRNEKDKNIKTVTYTLQDKENNLELKELTICEIYLPNYKKICYDKANKTEKKLYLFNCKSFDEMNKLNLSEEDKWIVLELERLAMDDKFIDDYDAEKVNQMLMKSEYNSGYDDGITQGIEQGILQGTLQGEKNKTIEIAKSLLKLNIPIEQIEISTKLNHEEVLKLKEEI